MNERKWVPEVTEELQGAPTLPSQFHLSILVSLEHRAVPPERVRAETETD